MVAWCMEVVDERGLQWCLSSFEVLQGVCTQPA
jgi:hypothetical protein